MTDRSPRTDVSSAFEASLARRLRAYADVPATRLEAHVEAAIDIAQRGQRFRPFLRLPAMPALRPAIAVGLLLVLTAAALLLAGMLSKEPTPLPGRLVYSSTDGGLYLADADGRGPHKVRDGRFGTPKWSADGRYIAVDRVPNSVDILRADGSLVEELPGGTSEVDFAWAPGPAGEHRLAARIDGAIVIKDVDSGATARVTGGVDEQVFTWSWVSASNVVWQRVNWAEPREVYEVLAARIDAAGSELTTSAAPGLDWVQPAPPTYESFAHFTLSPDGSLLGVSARIRNKLASDIGIIPVGGGMFQILSADAPSDGWLEWALDGRSIVIETLAGGGTTQLLVVPLDGSPAYPLFDQRIFDDWLLVDDSPVDLAGGRVLVGKVTNPLNGAHHANAPIMDLYVLDHGASQPRWIADSVLGADVVWP